jgi:hypothetical protein
MSAPGPDKGVSKPVYVAALKNKLESIYKEHNKENMEKIPYLLKKYKGEEELLYHSVCTKYKLESKGKFIRVVFCNTCSIS